MGTRISVFSSLTNLSQQDTGDISFAGTTIVSGILSGASKQGLGQFLSSTLLNSSGTKQRNYFNWANDNYTLGMPEAQVEQRVAVSTDAAVNGISQHISLGANDTLFVLNAFLDQADVEYWAGDWIRKNYPNLTEDDWGAYYDFVFDLIVIEMADGTQAQIQAPADLAWGMASPRAEKRLFFATYQIITQDPDTNEVLKSIPELFTYREGSGTAELDALFSQADTMADFFPAIPVRIDNVSIAEASMSDTYAMANKAFRKLTGSHISALVDSVDTHESVDDIDYAYVMQGVPLNTENQAGLRYIFEFFKTLVPYQNNEQITQSFYKAAQAKQRREDIQKDRWSFANEPDEDELQKLLHDFFGITFKSAVEPTLTTPPPKSQFRINSSEMPELDIRISWDYIREFSRSGNAARFDNDQERTLLEKGEYMMLQGAADQYIIREAYGRDYSTTTQESERFYILYQYGSYHYAVLEIVGMKHSNYIYGSRAVHTLPSDAFADTAESPFLVPLHYPTFQELGLMKATELSRNNTYLIVNSYVVQHTSWFQDFFGVIVFIAAIVLTIYFPPAGGGLLGVNATVGAAAGFTGASAVVAGAALNALAAMIVTLVITEAAKIVLGDELGAVVGAIMSFVYIGWETGSFGESFELSDLFRSDNLIQFTNSVSRGYAAALEADTMDLIEAMNEMEEAFGAEMDRIEQLAEDVFGVTNNAIDPMIFTDAAEHFGETEASFLGRTLMTGSDIAELSHSFVSDFVPLTLELPKDLR